MRIYDGQMSYNGSPRYNLSAEILRTKIMPSEVEILETVNGKVAIDENGEVVAVEEKANLAPLIVAAALAFVALG